jgi:glycosyltransferase involved in cell wall biosynthesis
LRSGVTADRIFYDLSEFVAGPRRTGIQRVSYEILRTWSFQPPLVPGFIRPDTGQAALLPNAFRALMDRFFAGGSSSETAIAGQIVACAADGATALAPRELGEFFGFLNPESFHGPARTALYRGLAKRRAKRIHWIVYDALIWTRPEFFPPGAAAQMAPYLEALRTIPNLHFISESCRRDFCDRILGMERPTYRVCSLGADGLGRAAADFSPRKRRFVAIGTVEPRKNHELLLRAFSEIWAGGGDAELAVVGKLGWTAREAGWRRDDRLGEEMARRAAENPRFTWHQDIDDAALRDIIVGSRATLYASEAEGFGLPPLESLALGVPVIASARLPSLRAIADLGQIRLSQVTVESLVAAIKEMLHDEVAAAKCAEISRLPLPTWAHLAETLHRSLLGSRAW